ncbi:MAG: biotin carboxylase N-terminal domain-containing protein [Acidimicrobiales bacterium]
MQGEEQPVDDPRPRPFGRLAIVNRGEAAMRLIHAVREFNAEHGTDIRTIALHTDGERSAMFVREADESVRLTSTGSGSPYLDHSALEAALVGARADAAWVGWGFVAEDPAFVELCERNGVTFIGPSADVMRRLGQKIEAKFLAEQAGIPVAPWSNGAVADVANATDQAAVIGYPLMIKAASGGGGRGIRMVHAETDLADSFTRARSEAERSFGDPTLFMEKLLTDVRHVEVQIIGDNYGTVWAVGVRDCSVQRRNQKVIEESSSTALSADQDALLRRSAVALAVSTGYRNAGTIEFLFQPATGTLAFLEVNPRLQVEHPVTELTTGVDLVKLQLHVAMGGRLDPAPPPARGHAIEARLNAEDPDRGFAPSPGVVEVLSLPTGPGIRVDTGIAEGDVIPPEFDSMVAKVIAWGRDREEARARLERALGEATVLIRDGTTNRAFLLDLLRRPELRSGAVDTRWLDRLTAEDTPTDGRRGAVALVVAAIEAADSAEAVRRRSFLATAARGRPELSANTGETVELRHHGQTYRAQVLHTGPGHHEVTIDGSTVDARVQALSPWNRRVELAGRRQRAVVQRQGTDQLVEVDGVAFRFSFDDGGLVRAPASGVVVVVHAAPGALVAAGDPLLVLEAMKMEVAITAPSAGRVREVLATPNVQVSAGSPLVRIDPVADEEASARPAARFDIAGLAADPAAATVTERCLTYLETLRCSLLGFESSPAEVRRVIEAYRLLRPQSEPGDATLVHAEMSLLNVFADLSILWRNRSGDAPGEDEETRGPSEYLNTYLRSLDVEREGLPPAFRSRLEQALSHYGVDDLQRSTALEESLYWLFHAQQRAPVQLQAVLALLDHRLDTASTLTPALEEEFHDTLDRLIVATQLRYPVIGDLARNIRYRWFDEPVIRRAAERDLHDMRAHLAALDSGDGDRAAHLEALVNCAQPILTLLAERDPQGNHLEPMVEVLTRRFYKIRPLTRIRAGILEGRNVVTAHYEHSGRAVNVIAAHIGEADLERSAEAIVEAVHRQPARETVVVDLYVATDGARSTAVPARMLALLDRRPPGEALTRVTLTMLEPGGDGGMRASHVTFRPVPGHARFAEDTVLRGLHPMIARRLHLWRLANFRTERLPSPPDAYLFRCTAPDNPKDERFIAVSEVRDLTPVRDADGSVVALPDLEHVLTACLEGLRAAQTDLPPNRRPSWNRVILHLWPTSEVPLDELLPIAGRIVPLTVGLGLESVLVQGRFAVTAGEPVEERVLRLAYQPGTGLTIGITAPPTAPMQPLDAYTQKVIEARRRGAVFPHEIVPLLSGPGGTFTEYDLVPAGVGEDLLAPVTRAPGGNRAGIIVGLVTTPTERHPEGMTRVALLGDPTMSLGSIAEPECRQVIAALDLAEAIGAPVEWFALSAGAKIAMDSGTENLDWVARALRRIIAFTQSGGEINVVVAGINVGAQPYWNAEATMLMHTRGILVMMPQSAMVLTGKQALEYSGGVSAEDNAGIGGYERIMGPNGQAQYWAPDLTSACAVLLAHYEYSYLAPGEAIPRRATSSDPHDRNICESPHVAVGSDFATVGDIFSETTNPGRKKPFDMRTLMRATLDADRPPLERWAHMSEADTVVVLDGHLGGRPVSMLGIESQPLRRFGVIPADGPDQWTAGTLFPLSSKKMARAINAASGTRPVVILANLSGFDGSPESLRRLQLEYGAEIGRAVVNFDGPIVFCVVSRYHGGAFVVFSATLNDRMQVLAVEGSHASVIGGAPAAAVVFTGEVAARVRRDARLAALEARIAVASESDEARLRAELAQAQETVRLEKLGEVAAEFDAVHTVGRALEVGSVHAVVPATELRPRLIAAVERGLESRPHPVTP